MKFPTPYLLIMVELNSDVLYIDIYAARSGHPYSGISVGHVKY